MGKREKKKEEEGTSWCAGGGDFDLVGWRQRELVRGPGSVGVSTATFGARPPLEGIRDSEREARRLKVGEGWLGWGTKSKISGSLQIAAELVLSSSGKHVQVC